MIINTPRIFKEILNIDEETLKYSLGDFGLRLKLFIESLDFDHPSSSNVFNDILQDNMYFSLYCSELFKVIKFVKDNNLEIILPSIGEVFKTDFKKIISDIDIPRRPKLYIRLLKDKNLREEIRSFKKKQEIDLYFLKNDQDFWQLQPDSFNSFMRFDSSYKEEIEKAKKRFKIYKQLGCSALAEENQTLINLIEHENTLYFGFHSIKLTTIAIVFAKVLKCSFEDGKIKKDIFYNHKNIEFTPKIYPLKEFWEIIPNYLKKLIDLLDNYPEMNNKPIFDHFGLVVPSFNLLKQENKKFYFTDLDGKENVFYNKDEALKELDLFLLKNDLINSVIVGEKDGKCYFLNYFNEL